MKAKPPNRWQSMPSSPTKAGGITPASPTKARRALGPDKCVFWIVILGSLIVAIFGV